MDNFQIYDVIGKGKYSVVYKGRKKKSIMYYAIKSVDKNHKAKIFNEVKMLTQLDHPNILKFINWYETSNHYWTIIEYCTGGDLLSILMQDQKLPEDTVHDFGLDLVNGLQYIHSKGIIYCDLKPSNILVDGYGMLKYSDFGLAKFAKDIEGSTTNLQKRGTPCYMAPELFLKETPTIYSDFWSLGCVLYELASGSPPFMIDNFEELVHSILNHEFKPLENYSSEFNELLKGLLAKNPAERFTWNELREHEFWKETIMPPEESALVYLDAQALHISSLSKSTSKVSKQDDVDRLSSIVRSNLEKENGPLYNKNKEDDNDIEDEEKESSTPNLRSITDMEYNFDESISDDESGMAENEQSHIKESNISSDEALVIDESDTKLAQKPENPLHHYSGSITPHGKQTNSQHDLLLEKTNQNLQQSQKKRPESSTGMAITQLIFTQADFSVRPIVHNSKIERVVESNFDKSSLPFIPISLKQFLSSSQSEIEKFLSMIYKSLGGNHTNIAQKIEVLSYFETLCSNTDSANLLINSSLMTLFVKMLKSYNSSIIKCKLCAVMGILMRHATFIHPDLSQTDIMEILMNLTKDRNGKVRKKALATLGELLFYIATQSTDNQASEHWSIPSPVVSIIVRCLKSTEEEIIQHYATKTIENISANSKYYAQKFANADATHSLISIFQKSKNEYLRASSISSLARMSRHKTSMAVQLIELMGEKAFISYLKDPNARVKQYCLNILNLAILHDAHSRATNQITHAESFRDTILQLIERNDADIINAKALVTISLLCKYYSHVAMSCCESKLCPILDKMILKAKKEGYISKCLNLVLHSLKELIPPVLHQISAELENIIVTRSSMKTKLSIQNLTTVLRVVTTGSLGYHVMSMNFIRNLANCLNQKDILVPSYEEITKTLLLIIESFSQQSHILDQYAQVILELLLPSLIKMMQSESGDIRFICLKIFTDILLRYIQDKTVFHPQANPDQVTSMITELMKKHLLPNYKKILETRDPIPLFGLRLLKENLQQSYPKIFVDLLSELEKLEKHESMYSFF